MHKNIYKKCLAKSYRYPRAICGSHLCMEVLSAHVSDGNPRGRVASGGSEFRSPSAEPHACVGFRATRKPSSSSQPNDWQLHSLKFCRLLGESGVRSHLLQEGLAPFWRRLEGSHRGPGGEDRGAEGGSGRPEERQKQEACCWSRGDRNSEASSTAQGRRLRTELQTHR